MKKYKTNVIIYTQSFMPEFTDNPRPTVNYKLIK
jgi:hypothetical protein